MAIDEIDREEVDRLVQEMAARRKAPVPKPTLVPSVPAAAAAQQPGAPQPDSPAPAKKASRWSTNRLLMPSIQQSSPRKHFAFASAMTMNLPAMPKIGQISLPNWTEAQWEVLTARMFVALGVALGIAMPYWPYTTAGPWSLGLYLSAVILMIVTGIWASKLTWDSRLARAHTVAIITVMWGLVLVAAKVLPRLGLTQ